MQQQRLNYDLELAVFRLHHGASKAFLTLRQPILRRKAYSPFRIQVMTESRFGVPAASNVASLRAFAPTILLDQDFRGVNGLGWLRLSPEEPRLMPVMLTWR